MADARDVGKVKELSVLFSRLKKVSLVVRGVSCAHCEGTVEKGLVELPRVDKVKASHSKNLVEVYYKEGRPDLEAVRRKVAELGYEAG